MINQETTSLPTEMGGLGISNLANKNCALLSQWGWGLLTEKD